MSTIYTNYLTASAVQTSTFARITNQLLPVIYLITFVLLSSTSFYLLQLFGDFPIKLPDTQFLGSCVDAKAENASFFRAFYFVATVFTAVGYGDVIPCTWPGKLLTIISVVLGVPMTLVNLSRMGKWLAKHVLDRACTEITKISQRFYYQQNECSEENAKKTKFGLAIVITAAWILIFGCYFHGFLNNFSEGGDRITYYDAVYFTIVTLFTVGFGDYYPGVKQQSIIGFVIFLMIGLSMISTCVSVMTNRINDDFDKITKALQHLRQGIGGNRQITNTKDSAMSVNSKEAELAKIVLDLCKADPTGKWLKPIFDAERPELDKVNNNIIAHFEPTIKAMKIWKRKTFTREIEVQTERTECHPFSVGI